MVYEFPEIISTVSDLHLLLKIMTTDLIWMLLSTTNEYEFIVSDIL